MNAGIGATRAMQADLVLKNIRNRLFNHFLDAEPDLLYLPALVIRAVIRDGQLKANRIHGRN
jgi:hypothetical protein